MSVSRKSSSEPITGNYPRKELTILSSSIPANLPALHGRIIGREKEMQFIRQVLSNDDARLVTLTGFGGVGKTTLALHSAHAMLELFSGGLFFIDLSLITDPAHILSAIAKTLNLQEEPQREVKDTLKDFLVNRSILFVLDNLEQVISGVPVIAEFLDANPHIRILATSREALRLRGEHVLPIAPLAGGESVQMFVQYAQTLNPDFRLTEDNTPAITELCKKLDGLPLAVELAAMRTRMFTPQALLARLQSDLGTGSPLLAALTSGPRDLPRRQQTMRETIAWSYSLLSETEQRAFRAASMFRGGFSLDGLRAVVRLSEAGVLDVVSSLVDKSLIQSRASEFDEAWLTMLDVISEFAAEQVSASGEEESFTQVFIAHFVEFAKRASAGFKSNEQVKWFKRTDANHANLLVAVNAALAAKAGSELWKSGFVILENLHLFWMLNGYFHMGIHAAQRGRIEIEKYVVGLKKKDLQLLKLQSSIYTLSGSIAWSQGNYEKARDWHESAYRIHAELNDEAGMVDALNNWAVNLSLLGEYDRALENYKKGILLCKKHGDQWGEMRKLNNMAGCLISLNRVDEAWGCYEQGLSLARELGDQYFSAAFLLNMGDFKVQSGKYQEALHFLEQSLEFSTVLKSDFVGAWSKIRLAAAYSGLGKQEAALTFLKDAYLSSTGLFDADLNRLLLETMATLLSFHGRHEQAAMLLGCLQEFVKRSRAALNAFESGSIKNLTKKIGRNFGEDQYRLLLARGAGMSAKEALRFGISVFDSEADVEKQVGGGLLTAREYDVLVLLALGKTNEEISRELVVVLKTVEKHVANILRKLGVKNRTEAAAWAVENGIK